MSASLNRLTWRPMALADRDDVMVYIAQDNPGATIDMELEFEAKAESARLRPKLYKAGRVKGTREIAVRPNCVMVYRIMGDVVEVLRVLHAAQQWAIKGRTLGEVVAALPFSGTKLNPLTAGTLPGPGLPTALLPK